MNLAAEDCPLRASRTWGNTFFNEGVAGRYVTMSPQAKLKLSTSLVHSNLNHFSKNAGALYCCIYVLKLTL